MPIPSEGDLKWAISDLLNREINPAVGQHGGWVELIDVKKNNVYLRLGGGCQGCGAADVTLRQGIEKAIRELVPRVGEILDTTDHAASLMIHGGFRHLPVIDGDTVVGIVSIRDLMRVTLGDTSPRGA